MKKWWILPLAIGAAVVLGVTSNSQNEPMTVKSTVLQTQKIEQTVSCNGVVEAGEVEGVFALQTCIVQKVLVEVGQRVSAGDRLIAIDKEATRQLQMSGDRLSGALSLTAMNDEITAPTDGIVLSVETAVGMMLETTVPCVTIAPDSGLQVRVMIREKLLPSLEVGQKVQVSGSGFDKKLYCGHLSEISSAASDIAGGESIVEGVIALDEGEADESMRLGLSAKAKVVISTIEQGILIPYEAILQSENGESYVYFAKDGRATRRLIESQGEFAEGVLVSQADWVGSTLILEPEKIAEDGVTVSIAQGDAE